MTVLFTGDTHFGDPRVLRLDRRPYATIAKHDTDLIARWNATVQSSDDVWHLGDFALGQSSLQIEAILNGLNGNKHLIVGNNDGESTIAACGWKSIQHYVELTLNGMHLVLCHYPFRTWNRMGRGVIDIHGHSHGKLKPFPRQYDVGVDVFGFRPINLSTILSSRARGRKV